MELLGTVARPTLWCGTVASLWVFFYILSVRVAFSKGELIPLQCKVLIPQLAQDVSGA